MYVVHTDKVRTLEWIVGYIRTCLRVLMCTTASQTTQRLPTPKSMVSVQEWKVFIYQIHTYTHTHTYIHKYSQYTYCTYMYIIVCTSIASLPFLKCIPWEPYQYSSYMQYNHEQPLASSYIQTYPRLPVKWYSIPKQHRHGTHLWIAFRSG